MFVNHLEIGMRLRTSSFIDFVYQFLRRVAAVILHGVIPHVTQFTETPVDEVDWGIEKGGLTLL